MNKLAPKKQTRPVVAPTAKHARSMIRSLNRAFARDDTSPQVVRKTVTLHEPTVCPGCGAVYVRKSWRRDHKLSEALLARLEWHRCPACEQVQQLEGQGRLLIRGAGAIANRDTIRQRIHNIAARAAKQQPERRITSIEDINTKRAALEVLTTSQKLTHRIVHELKKLYGGRADYEWGDDGTLFATWDCEAPKKGKKQQRR